MREMIIPVYVLLGFMLCTVLGFIQFIFPGFVISKRNEFIVFAYGRSVRPPPSPMAYCISGLIVTIIGSAVVYSILRKMFR